MRIYHTSDLHDHRGIAAPLQAMRERNPGLLFDCGDSLRGSQTVYHRREPIVEEMDRAGYDAQAIGNREFHYLFGCMGARLARMRRPVVCTNLIDTKRRPLPFARTLTIDYGSDAAERTRVHLVGLLIMQYGVGSAWERVFGWRFLDPIEAVREAAAQLPADEPLIVLSHLGLRWDRRLAAAIPAMTLLLGGHSHDTLHEPEIVEGVPIVHAGPYGAYVSQSDLERGSAGWHLRDFTLRPLLARA